MKVIYTLILIMMSSSSFVQGQTNIPTVKVELDEERPHDWQLYVSNLDYKIEYKFINCDPSIGFDQEMIIFRFTNRTKEQLKFNWHVLLDYNKICKTCDYPNEYSYGVIIPPLESLEGSCSINEEYNLKIFSKFIDANYTKGEHLTGFELGNLTLN